MFQALFYLDLWRWCFFCAGTIPIFYTSSAAIYVAVLMIETYCFTSHQALYYIVSIQAQLPLKPRPFPAACPPHTCLSHSCADVRISEWPHCSEGGA